MTRITLSSNASGTGNVNFAAPNTNSAVTVTLPTSNVDMDALGPSTTVGDVTTYGLLVSAANYGTYNPGDTLAGSALRWTNTSNQQSGTPSGTWQMCGYSVSSDTPTVWQRIS